MKRSETGTMYFQGIVTDGKNNLRVVGFNVKQQQKLAQFQDQKQPIAIVNCEVKQNKWGTELEVFMSKYTDVIKSPVKFEDVSVPDDQLCDS